MTRENKLALIIGFTLILMVGVLVSDHLSRARQAELDASASEDAPAQVDRQRVYSGELLDTAIEAARERGTRRPPPATRISPVNPRSGTPAPEPQPTAQPAARQGTPAAGWRNDLYSTPGASTTGAPAEQPVVIHQGAGLDALTEVVPDETVGVIDLGSASALFERMRSSATPPPASRAERPRTIASVPGSERLSDDVRPARVTRHTVRGGDSLYRLAERYYDDGSRWREIQKANRDLLRGGADLQPGQVLTIPDVAPVTIAGPSSAPVSTSTSASGSGSGSGYGSARTSSGGTYTVKPGDTLGEIASDLLGTSRRAGDIVEANRGTISNPNEIRVGMVLKIPSR